MLLGPDGAGMSSVLARAATRRPGGRVLCPGAAGVGPGRASALLKKWGTLEAALEAGGFPDQADRLR